MYSGSDISGHVPKTDQMETFFDEDRRWDRDTMENPSLTSTDYSNTSYGFSYWLTASNADYNSNQPLNTPSTNPNLQQTYEGILKWPYKDYSVDGNGITINNNLHSTLPNYTELINAHDRYYYTALRFADGTYDDNTLDFKIKVYGDFIESDIFKSEFDDQFINDSDIRVDIKFPGPEGKAGSDWSNIGFFNSNGDVFTEGWNSYNSRNDQLASSGHIEFGLSTIDRSPYNSGGVLLFRIRYKVNVGISKYISKLELIP
jgi:hypothetical protein